MWGFFSDSTKTNASSATCLYLPDLEMLFACPFVMYKKYMMCSVRNTKV